MIYSFFVRENIMTKSILVDSSDKTLEWLEILERKLKKEVNSDLKITYKTNWVPLKKQGEKSNLAYLHPQKSQIRVVIRFLIQWTRI
jgi:hypothetical protein